jgi:hypothetical protein
MTDKENAALFLELVGKLRIAKNVYDLADKERKESVKTMLDCKKRADELKVEELRLKKEIAKFKGKCSDEFKGKCSDEACHGPLDTRLTKIGREELRYRQDFSRHCQSYIEKETIFKRYGDDMMKLFPQIIKVMPDVYLDPTNEAECKALKAAVETFENVLREVEEKFGLGPIDEEKFGLGLIDEEKFGLGPIDEEGPTLVENIKKVMSILNDMAGKVRPHIRPEYVIPSIAVK